MAAHHQINLFVESRSQRGDNPRIFIDCEMHRGQLSLGKQCDAGLQLKSGPLRRRQVAWAKDLQQEQIAHMLYGRVLAPLSSVICYFASDLGGVRGVARLIANQLLSGTLNRLHPEALPRVLVIVETTSYVFDSSIVEARLLEDMAATMAEIGHGSKDLWPELLTHFHEVRVLGLQKHGSSGSRAKILRRRITAVSSSAHATRRISRSLLSTSHSYAFFGLLLNHFCHKQDLFDFVRSSRASGFSLHYFPMHLKDLLGSVPAEAWLWHTVTPLVASTLFFASYPSGSHCKLSLILFKI